MSEGNGTAALLGYPEEWSEDQAAIDDLDSRRHVDDPAAALGAIKSIATRQLSREAQIHSLAVFAAKDSEAHGKRLDAILLAISDLRAPIDAIGKAQSRCERRLDVIEAQGDLHAAQLQVVGARQSLATKDVADLAGETAEQIADLDKRVRLLKERVGRDDSEDAQVRAKANEALELARAAKASADDSKQQAIVDAKTAEARVAAADARIKSAELEERLHVEREARQSLTTEITVKKTERRARRWSLREKLLAAALLCLTGGLGYGAKVGVEYLLGHLK